MAGATSKGAEAGAKEYARKPRKKTDSKAVVHVTPYGTRYVLPIDLLFSREDMDRFVDEARAEHSKKTGLE